jgi:NAD(P)-dependent dehydrogenase (short-subunit alcohol dehydrogenase family)
MGAGKTPVRAHELVSEGIKMKTSHPALAAGRVAVITGAAHGIGLATAKRFASMGMKIVMADLASEALQRAADEAAAVQPNGKADILVVPTDVSDLAQVQALADAAYNRFGEVAVLMNNAGIGIGGGPWENVDRWRKVLEVNLWGVINGVQTFAPRMLAQKTSGAIINTGSKQGITCPPGNTAYNVSKAGVKVLSEALAHSLRNEPGAHISAHLLIPGSTLTEMTRPSLAGKESTAWTADQVVDMLVTEMAAGTFYILCPDNEVTRDTDNRRMLWAAQDVIKGRPALSRWHPDYKDEFQRFLNAQ